MLLLSLSFIQRPIALLPPEQSAFSRLQCCFSDDRDQYSLALYLSARWMLCTR